LGVEPLPLPEKKWSRSGVESERIILPKKKATPRKTRAEELRERRLDTVTSGVKRVYETLDWEAQRELCQDIISRTLIFANSVEAMAIAVEKEKGPRAEGMFHAYVLQQTGWYMAMEFTFGKPFVDALKGMVTDYQSVKRGIDMPLPDDIVNVTSGG
jgi:hypothetical protein